MSTRDMWHHRTLPVQCTVSTISINHYQFAYVVAYIVSLRKLQPAIGGFPLVKAAEGKVGNGELAEKLRMKNN